MTSIKQATVIVLSDQQDLAEAVQNEMRNAGHAVRTRWINSLKALQSALAEKNAELLLCEPGSAMPLDKVLKLRDEHCRNLPLVLNDGDMSPNDAAAALDKNVRAIVTLEHTGYLCNVLLKEIEAGQQARARQLAEEQLLKLAKRHRSLMEDSSEAVAYLQEGIHLRCNRQYAKVFGYESPDDIAGLPLMDIVAKNDRDSVRKLLKDCEAGKGNPRSEGFNALAKDGSAMALSLKLTKLDSGDDTPQIEVLIPHEAPPSSFAATAGLAGGMHSGRHSLFAALRSLAEHGVGSGVCAFMFLSVDNAARMEERLGFLAADQVSNELAAFVLDRISDSDRAFRFSDYEIGVLLFRPNMQAATVMAEGLQKSIGERSYGGARQSTSLTVSAMIKPLAGNIDPDQLIRDARKQIKRLQAGEGGGLYLDDESYNPNQNKDDQRWVTQVREALEHNNFRLVFQKIISLEGEDEEFLDAFVRMVGEKGEEILAGSFVPVAERHGLMPMIDQWVIKRAAAAVHQRRKAGHPSVVLVRLSESTVSAEEVLLPWLKKFLEVHKDGPPPLTFTVKEESLIDNYAKASKLIRELRAMDCRCAVSHFGGSSRSMELIKDVDLDFVKLQGSLTQKLANGEEDPKISKIISQVTERDIKIVAEQVEDATAMATLWQMGIHYVQGEQIESA